MAPWLFIVPGLYEGPEAFEPLTRALRAAGHDHVHTTRLPSTGCDPGAKPLPTMDDDVAAVARDLSAVVDAAAGTGDGVVVLLHSAAGFVGGAAMEGLTAPARARAGLRGGVTQMVFLAAGVVPEGVKHKPQPFMVFDDQVGIQRCRDPMENLFHDFSPDEAQRWASRLQHQPGREWDQVVRFCGWKEVPSVFILAEKDRLLPASVQEKVAALAGSKTIVRVDGGHMLQLSRTDEVASIVADVLAGAGGRSSQSSKL